MGTVSGQQNFSGVTGWSVAKPHINQEADEAADHLVTEGIGPNFEYQNIVPLVDPLCRIHPAMHGRNRSALNEIRATTERRKIVLPYQWVNCQCH
jgi:hypothetical protein